MTKSMQRLLRTLVSAGFVAGLLLGNAPGALAQTDGRFTGAILDQTGAALVGATVTVKNEKTGEERSAVTNAQGRYSIVNLKPSTYTVKVTYKEFKPLEYTGFALAAAQEMPLDLTM